MPSTASPNVACAVVRHLDDLIFNFFPVTAIMIVVLALLNDGAILSSPTTTSATSASPRLGTCAWSSGWPPFSAWSTHCRFGLFCLAKDVYHLDHAHLQTSCT